MPLKTRKHFAKKINSERSEKMKCKNFLFAIAISFSFIAGGCSQAVTDSGFQVRNMEKIEDLHIPYDVSQLDLYRISNIQEQDEKSIFLLGLNDGKLLYAINADYDFPNAVMALKKTEMVNIYDIQKGQVIKSYPFTEDFYVLYGTIAGKSVLLSGLPLKEDKKSSQILSLGDEKKILYEGRITNFQECPKLVPFEKDMAMTLLQLPDKKGFYSVAENGLSEILFFNQEEQLVNFDFKSNGKDFLTVVKKNGNGMFLYANKDTVQYLKLPEGLKIVTYALCGKTLVLYAKNEENDVPVLYWYSFMDQSESYRIADVSYRIPDGKDSFFVGINGNFEPFLYQIKDNDIYRNPIDLSDHMETTSDYFQIIEADTGQILFNAPENKTVFIIQTD